jgi:hypothetical protein
MFGRANDLARQTDAALDYRRGPERDMIAVTGERNEEVSSPSNFGRSSLGW